MLIASNSYVLKESLLKKKKDREKDREKELIPIECINLFVVGKCINFSVSNIG